MVQDTKDFVVSLLQKMPSLTHLQPQQSSLATTKNWDLKSNYIKLQSYRSLFAIGVFMGSYHSICKVLTFWLPTVEGRIIEEFVSYTVKFADFSSKQTDMSSIQDNLEPHPKWFTKK